jgi:hypothetical protein
VLQRSGTKLTGYNWMRGGALHRVFHDASFGAGAGRVIIRAENADTGTGKAVVVNAARVTGVAVSADETRLEVQ